MIARSPSAKPDGYTLGYGNINTLAVNPALFNKLPYDANKDFVVGRPACSTSTTCWWSAGRLARTRAWPT